MMLKQILKLSGAQQLNRSEQQEINGGLIRYQPIDCYLDPCPNMCSPGYTYNQSTGLCCGAPIDDPLDGLD